MLSSVQGRNPASFVDLAEQNVSVFTMLYKELFVFFQKCGKICREKS
jgi:hypothetical protein